MSLYNKVDDFETAQPFNSQGAKDRFIIFHYSYDGKVILVASADGMFPFWVSETSVDDKETNATIMKMILSDSFDKTIKPDYRLTNLYHNRYSDRIAILESKISTPFGHTYTIGDENINKYVADDLWRHFNHQKDLCEFRELDGEYLKILDMYLQKLSQSDSDDAVKAYEDNRTLIELLTNERYLYLSDNTEIREKYIEIREQANKMYSAYMNIVR